MVATLAKPPPRSSSSARGELTVNPPLDGGFTTTKNSKQMGSNLRVAFAPNFMHLIWCTCGSVLMGLGAFKDPMP
eukprot:COSAG02_NODE_1256_length_13576_cov_12.901981_8_plen_75_part_00